MVISISVTLSTCFDLDYVFADWCIGWRPLLDEWKFGWAKTARSFNFDICSKVLIGRRLLKSPMSIFLKSRSTGVFSQIIEKCTARDMSLSFWKWLVTCSNHPSGVGMGSSPHEFWCNFFDEALSMLAIWTYPSVLSNSRKANDEAKKKKKKAEQKNIKRTLWREAEGIHLVYHKLFQTSWV